MKAKLLIDVTINDLDVPSGDAEQQVVPFNNIKAQARQHLMKSMESVLRQAEVKAGSWNVVTAIIEIK